MHPEWSLRQARMADLPALLALEDQRFDTDRIGARSFRRWLRLGHKGLAVAVQDGRLVGYVLVLHRRNSHSARLYSIAVWPEAAGKGLGRALLAWAEEQARAWGATGMRLEVQPGNRAARSLYESAGYGHIARLPGFYENGADALRMGKTL